MNKVFARRLLAPLLLTAALPAAGQTPMTVAAGGTLTIGNGVTLHVLGDVLVAGTLRNEGTVQLTGHLSSSGSLLPTPTPGQWRLVGSTPQQLTVADELTSLEVVNAAGGQLAAPLRIGQLRLSGGPVYTGNHLLTVGTGGITAADGATGRFVVTDGAGSLRQDVGSAAATFFPVGPAASAYAPVTLTRAAPAASYAVRAAAGALAGGGSGAPFTADAVGLHWELAAPDAEPYDLRVQWAQPQELSSFNRNQSALSRWTGTAYAALEPFGSAGGNGVGPYTRTVTGLTAAGTFIVADQQAPLPVELISFDAQRLGTRPLVQLRWTTAQERNNAGFEVQRRDAGQAGFHRVGYVAGGGTRTTAATYAFQDPNAFEGTSYYRLRQLDHDGAEAFSAIRPVAGLAGGIRFSLSAYPNPAATALTLEATGHLPADLLLTLYAADGRLIMRWAWPAAQARQLVSLASLPVGSYRLRYTAADGTAGTLGIVVAR